VVKTIGLCQHVADEMQRGPRKSVRRSTHRHERCQKFPMIEVEIAERL
jgi:hypothetical protein